MRGADLLMVGIPGADLDSTSEKQLARLRPGGLVLLPRNVDDDPDHLVDLITALRAQLPETLFAIDAEGGRVDSLAPLLGGAPTPGQLGRGSPSLAFETGRWLGHGVRLFDIDVALAPVVDLDRGEQNNALDGRYLGADPEAVTVRARAFLRGLHSAGVAGCLKHFPGLGGATDDTHYQGSKVYLPRRELARDLEPFRDLAEFAGAVMVGHANYPAHDRDGLPATLSPAILGPLLRDEVGFRGVAFSDDLEMKALDGWGELAERAEAALLAGCDLLLVCQSLEAAEEAAGRLDAGLLATRREEAYARLRRFREHRRSLAVRHEQERVDAGVLRGYDFETIEEKLAALREAAARQDEQPEAAPAAAE